MWRTTGHDMAVGILRRSLETGRASHAYLLAGPRQIGKMTLALDMARALNCVGDEKPCGECSQCRRIADGLHADVRTVGLESDGAGGGRGRTLIGIDQVREVQREASLMPFEGANRVFIIDGAERLSEEAANSLLKTLEEPPEQVVLMLLASESGALLPTITSRCQLLELRPVPASAVSALLVSRYGADRAHADEVARLSGGRPGWAIEAVSSATSMEELDKSITAIERLVQNGLEERFAYAADLAYSIGRSRDAGRRELALWLGWWRDVMLAKEGASEFVTHLSRLGTIEAVAGSLSSAQVARAINAVQETIVHLERNVNPRLALENLMLSLPRPSGGKVDQ